MSIDNFDYSTPEESSSVPGSERLHTSYSEINTWTQCKQKWYWSYEKNLESKGFSPTMMVGSLGHIALKAHFKGEDYIGPMANWIDERKENFFHIEEIDTVFDNLTIIVLDVMARYIRDFEDKHWEIVTVEQPFSIPIKGLTRKMNGVFDLIIKAPDGKFWLVEHKWPKNLRPEEYVELDTQIGIYQWAANRLGIPIVGTVYNQLVQKMPTIPSINQNKSGTPGKWVSRAKIRSDWETYAAVVRSVGDDPDLYIEEMAPHFAGIKWFERYYVYRSPNETKTFAEQLAERSWDLEASKKHIYMNESWMNCRSCQFRDLCITKLKGGDVEGVIEEQFQTRKRDTSPNEIWEVEADFE